MLRGRRRRVWYSVLLLAGRQRAAPSSCCTEQIDGASEKWSYRGSRAPGEAPATLPGVLQTAPRWQSQWCLKGEEILRVPTAPLRRRLHGLPWGERGGGAGTGGPRRRRGGESGPAAAAGAAWEQAERGSAHPRVKSTASARAPGLARARGASSGKSGAPVGGASVSVRRARRPAERRRTRCHGSPLGRPDVSRAALRRTALTAADGGTWATGCRPCSSSCGHAKRACCYARAACPRESGATQRLAGSGNALGKRTLIGGAASDAHTGCLGDAARPQGSDQDA